jgi:hypothetical protein
MAVLDQIVNKGLDAKIRSEGVNQTKAEVVVGLYDNGDIIGEDKVSVTEVLDHFNNILGIPARVRDRYGTTTFENDNNVVLVLDWSE